MICRHLVLFIFSMCLFAGLRAQNYHALNGSSYAGSIGVHNNPSSIVNTPFKWDVTILGIQGKASTNIVSIRNYSLLSAPSNSEYYFPPGEKSRYGTSNLNINLLNTRIALSRTKSIAFGANLRNYTRIKTGVYNYSDTFKTVSNFLRNNQGNQPLWGDVFNSGWIELYATYAQTIMDDGVNRLNAGVTLKVNRGIAGARGSLQNGRFSRVAQGDPPFYAIESAQALYGYSSNFDQWKAENSTGQNLQKFVTQTQGGASLDIGVEWLIRPQGVSGAFDDDNYFDYDWKIGLSLLDLGASQYTYGLQSRTASGIRAGITSADINNKFDSTIRSMDDFNDSLGTIVESFGAITGKFRVLHPTRTVINVDRYVFQAFYINAELSLNLSGIFGKRWMYVKELNALTITPRWETRKWGVYMPISYNVENQLWIGAGAKLGPLVIGLHNLSYIFSKKSIHNGGGYVALIIRSPNDIGRKGSRQLNCPPNVW